MPEYAEILIRCGATIVVAFIITRICLVLVRRFQAHVDAKDTAKSELHRRSRTLASVLRGLILAVVWTVAAITVLDQAGVQVAPILAAAGIAGIALGFGAQSLVKDILAGFFILMENQYDVGDVIQVAGVSGTVEAVNMRTTVLRALDGSRHVVPNGEIKVSSNLTKVYSRYLFVLPVPYEQDVDDAVAVLQEVAEELRQDPEFGPLMTAPLTVLGRRRVRRLVGRREDLRRDGPGRAVEGGPRAAPAAQGRARRARDRHPVPAPRDRDPQGDGPRGGRGALATGPGGPRSSRGSRSGSARPRSPRAARPSRARTAG